MPTDLNFPIDVQTLIAGLPAGLESAIIDILSRHVGRENVISRKHLLDNLAAALLRQGVRSTRHDRSVRLTINQLRKKGYPICSTGGWKGGYFLAASREELNQYLALEIHSRAMDLLEQERTMRAQGDRLWPPQATML